MLVRSRASFDILSVSALDLFASALGSFMLLALMLFPYWIKHPALEAEQAAAATRLTEAEQAKSAAEHAIAAAHDKQSAATATLERARDRLTAAQAAADTAAQAAAKAASAAAARPLPVVPRVEAVAPPPAPPRRSGIAIDPLDLVVVMDTTGSMRDELADAQANMLGLIRILGRLSPSFRVGFVAYRDRGDAYVTTSWPLGPADSGSGGIVGFVRGLSAKGGGDDPEAVDAALADAVAMAWRTGIAGRIIVVGDASAHPNDVARTLQLAQQFHASGTARSVSTLFTGGNPSERTFFQRLAQSGGGDFSDHEGGILEAILMSVLGAGSR